MFLKGRVIFLEKPLSKFMKHCPPHVAPESCETLIISFVGGMDLIQ